MSNLQPVQIGDLVAAQFRLKEQLRYGKDTYRALDLSSPDTEVAIKILPASSVSAIERAWFKREIELLQTPNYPHIASIRYSGWWEAGQAFYIVRDYWFSALSALQVPQNRDEKYQMMREMGAALAQLHGDNIIHGNIQPSNILWDEAKHCCLADHGINQLRSRITKQPVSIDQAYASPEQRQKDSVANRQSDIYALGSIFFHILSGQTPFSRVDLSSRVNKYIPEEPEKLRNILIRMVVQDPAQRAYSNAELMVVLDEITSQVLPKHYLIPTNTAIREVLGDSNDDYYYGLDDELRQDVSERIHEQLGGSQGNEVHIGKAKDSEDDIIVLGNSFRFICTPNENRSAWVIKTIHCDRYQLDIEAEKERSMPYRASWKVILHDDFSLTPNNPDINQLLIELDNSATRPTTGYTLQGLWSEIIDNWQTELERLKQQTESSGFKYNTIVVESEHYRFVLNEKPNDLSDWEDEVMLVSSYVENGRYRFVEVGRLIGIDGINVRADKSGKPGSDIPRPGALMPDPTPTLSAIRRQQDALQAFRSGRMVNPHLASVITEPWNLNSTVPPSFHYFQDWLSEDKKEAVRKAVACNQLFLVQGPPGTGKTSMITEIVLQILHRDPDARILISSQSNIAVEHALAQITDMVATQKDTRKPIIIRIARNPDSTQYALGKQLDSWRKDVQAKCERNLNDLEQEVSRTNILVKVTDALQSESRNELSIKKWVDKSRKFLVELQAFEQYHKVLVQRVEQRPTQLAVSAHAYMDAVLSEMRREAQDYLDMLPDVLHPVSECTGLDTESVVAMMERIVKTNPDLPALEADIQRIQETRKILTEWLESIGRDEFKKFLIRSANVVGATCLFSANDKAMHWQRFDWTIIDEAGRATLPEALIPIMKSTRTILVGDERQLPPMIDDEADKNKELEISLFQRLAEQDTSTRDAFWTSLRTQYRMHPAIGNLISSVFYDGNLKQGKTVTDFQNEFGWIYDWMPAPVTWISTTGSSNRQERKKGLSFINYEETNRIAQWLLQLEAHCPDRGEKLTVGVISGYLAQAHQLKNKIRPTDQRWGKIAIEIATVDAFQGRECDVIMYSTVRSNQHRNIGFLRDARRINVALSRARVLLVIVGDDNMMSLATIKQRSNPFADVLRHIQSNPSDCSLIRENKQWKSLLSQPLP